MCVCVREGGREGGSVNVCVCVCVCEGGREGGREIECVCECLCVCIYFCS